MQMLCVLAVLVNLLDECAKYQMPPSHLVNRAPVVWMSAIRQAHCLKGQFRHLPAPRPHYCPLYRVALKFNLHCGIA